MILGYMCEGFCGGIHDELERLVVYEIPPNGNELAMECWLCSECAKPVEEALKKDKLFSGYLVGLTGETKSVDMFKVKKSILGRR